MSYEEDPNSFLFGLNQFTSPPADQRDDSATSSNMLAGLEAFASDDLGGLAQGDEHGQAPNFADQLALWTSANFSFDGPTGHALIGDEEKEKEEAENNQRREEENRRNEADNHERMARNTAASSRGGNAARGKARETYQHHQNDGPHDEASHPQGHAQQALSPQQQPQPQPQQQQQQQLRNFFGAHAAQAKSPPATSTGYGTPTAAPDQSHTQRTQQMPNSHMSPPPGQGHQAPQANAGAAAFPPFFPGFAGFGQFGGMAPQQSPLAGQMPGIPQLDMTSALALQHLLASNPFALASLGQFAGFTNPQLQAHLASLAGSNVLGGGGINAFVPPGMHQANTSQTPSSWDSQQATRQGGSSSASGAPAGWPQQAAPSIASATAATSVPAPEPAAAPATSATDAGSFANRVFNGAPAASNATSSGSAAILRSASSSQLDKLGESQSSSFVPTKKKRLSVSNGKKAGAGSDDNSDDGAKHDDDHKFEIPPLKLIDTGNPEADAEANRQAIEEDKRRRNTAASARFRIKKKQREAALEHTAKELQQRVADLESENARLRTENGWLKSLITVQPGQRAGGAPPSSSFGGAAAGPSRGPGNAVVPPPLRAAPEPSREESSEGAPVANGDSTSRSTQEQTERNSGLVPRGVGTASANQQNDSNANGAALKRDREE